MLWKTTLIWLPALLSFGCNSDDPKNSGTPSAGNPTPATAADLTKMCENRCAWELRCATTDNPASPTCQTDCESETSKPEAWRTDALAVMASCFSTLACGTGDDGCSAQAIRSVVADPATDPRYESCRSRYDSCKASDPGSFSDDICTLRFILTDAVQAPLDQCLAGACVEVNDCIDTLLGTG
jgi:hypothetical protein